jgi:hypothetical protein
MGGTVMELEPLRLTEGDVEFGRALVVYVYSSGARMTVDRFAEPGTTAHLRGSTLVVRSPDGDTLALVNGNYSAQVTVG